jgi:hypothetical protein
VGDEYKNSENVKVSEENASAKACNAEMIIINQVAPVSLSSKDLLLWLA